MVLSNAQWFANPGVVYEIDESCRFNRADSAYMYQTPGGAASSARLGTISVWIKRASVSTQEGIIDQHRSDGLYDGLIFNFNSDGVLNFAMEADGGAVLCKRATTQLFRDPGAWYHIVIGWDSNQTDDTCCTMYVNGEAVTAFGTKTNFGSAQDLEWLNTSKAVSIGRSQNAANYCDLYMSQFAVIDGSKLTAASFGETNSTTGQWIPKDITGLTYGNEGFLFAFQDSSALGDDTSGNSNDFTTSGLAAADQVVDTPTDNFCTMSPLNNTEYALSNGNLYGGFASSSTNVRGTSATMAYPRTGKWYWEGKNEVGPNGQFGIRAYDGTQSVADFCTVLGVNSVNAYGITGNSGTLYDNGSTSASGETWVQGDTYGVAFDVDSGKLWFSKNGTWISGDPEDGSSPSLTISTAELANDLYPWGASESNTHYQGYDFGQNDFWNAAPSGFSTLSTANFDDPTIADPSAYFQTTLYTGNGSTQSVNQGGNSTFEPDLVWIKNRSAADNHCVFDSVRGATEVIFTNESDAQTTDADTLTAFDSDGFSLGDDDKVNTNTENFVAWQWLESNTPALDIVQYEGTGSKQTISHGLGVAPDLIIFKNIDSAQGWAVYHRPLGPEYEIRLSTTTAAIDDAAFYDDDNPTSSVFTVNTNSAVNGSGNTIIAYVFAEVEGFSKVGKYIGNGSTDGPFIWFGFRPAYFLFKRTDSADNWRVYDNQRGPYNPDDARLEPNGSGAEASGDGEDIDFLSNGLKLRSSDTGWNASGGTYIFWAFADTPFKTANAR